MSKPAIIYSQDYLSAKGNGKYIKYENFIDYINNEKKTTTTDLDLEYVTLEMNTNNQNITLESLKSCKEKVGLDFEIYEKETKVFDQYYYEQSVTMSKKDYLNYKTFHNQNEKFKITDKWAYSSNEKYLNVKNRISDFIEYIDNNEKIRFPSFSSVGTLNNKQVDEIRERFEKSRVNENNLYRGVFSFDNAFLIKEGLVDEQLNIIDKDKMIVCIQNAMKEMNKHSRIDMNKMVWIANFHFNTDNIHCHIAYIDEDEARLSKEQKKEMVINEKGMEKAKSKVISTIVQDKEFLIEKSRIRDEMRRKINLKDDNLFDLVSKYGMKLLYLNTEKSVFTVEEVDDINEKLFEIIVQDDEMSKCVDDYNQLGICLDERYNKYYGGKEGRFLENMNEDICKIMQTALKKSLRKISNDNDSFFKNISLLNKRNKLNKKGMGLLDNVRTNFINYKLTNNLKRIFKKDIYEQINEQEKINMNTYYSMQRR